ncbi:polysaccharide deacetylase family protein [Mesorhizobium sp.]|uniref:polysaccharide deacetylase family protein n=1 Tax=Mesorhizobium sp. TaxID=1871066 RepID=UPI0025F1F081|nr:polysaccharide deacetylase family protein [Mesorhizobium sp.]
MAIQIVVNYEEGGERSPLYGDSESESFLLEQPTAASSRRDLNAESQYEFGSRSGFWRLHRLLTERNIPVTVFGVASAMAQNPDAVSAMMEAGWEVASHGLRWRSYADVDRSTEHEEIQKAIDLHTKLTGSRPTGWYTGRMSPNTRELLCECGGFLYDSNAFNDELPYWVDVKESKKHLVIPYTHDCNDMRYLTPYGFQFERFSTYLLETLDLFRREGRTCPKMMSVGLHNRISGRAGRARDLERFLDELVRASDVWLATRVAIAEHWHAHHKPE